METCLFIKLQLFQMKLATTTSEEVVEFLSGGELWGNGGTAALLSRMPKMQTPKVETFSKVLNIIRKFTS